MFSAVDAQQYKAYGEYLFDTGGYASSTRPYLYPLLVEVLFKSGGVQFLWFFQFLLHVVGGMLLFASNRNTLRSVLLWFGIVVLYGMHPTLLAQTSHALTESVITFLICVLVYVQFSDPSKKTTRSVLVLSVASVIKPLFLYLFFVVLIALLYRSLRTKSLYKPYKLSITVSIIVVMIQPLIMKKQEGSFFFSKIGGITVQDYYLQLLYARIKSIPFPIQSGPNEKDAQTISSATATWTTKDILIFAAQHPATALLTGGETIISNLDSGSQLLPGTEKTFPMLHKWAKVVRKLTVGFHLLALLGITVLAFRKSAKKWLIQHPIPVLTLLYIIITSGISFWQGDRLVIIALPIWLITYAALFKIIVRILNSKA
jgi:hypothetical protein